MVKVEACLTQFTDSKRKTGASDSNLPHNHDFPGQQPISRSSLSKPSPSELFLKTTQGLIMGPPKPRGILVKRSVSEGAPNKDHDPEVPHHRQSSLSLRQLSNNTSYFTECTKEGLRGSNPEPSTHHAPVAAVQTQSTMSPHRRLRLMNAEWSDEEEATVASVSSFEPAVPRRTVSFAPVPETQQLCISETSSPTSSVHYSNISFRADLPRVLQAGIRSDTPERQGVRPTPPVATLRQLALWEEEEPAPEDYGQGEHFQQQVGASEAAQMHAKMLDERMKEIASKGTWSIPSHLGNATPGYVATMRRQQYADAHSSFRRPERGLSNNSGESRTHSVATLVRFSAITDNIIANHNRLLLSKGASMSLKLENEAGWDNVRAEGARRSKSLRETALEA